MAKKALRHQVGREPQSFDVLKEYPDGTVDLGLNGALVIGRSLVSTDGRPGTATLEASAPTKAELKKAAKVARDAADKAAADAAAKPDSEELKLAAEEAEKAALEAEEAAK